MPSSVADLIRLGEQVDQVRVNAQKGLILNFFVSKASIEDRNCLEIHYLIGKKKTTTKVIHQVKILFYKVFVLKYSYNMKKRFC